MAKVAVFASGTGSNFIAIHRYLQAYLSRGKASHHVCCLVSDKPACGAVTYAREQNIPVILMNYAKGLDRGSVERTLVSELERVKPDLLALAGFMRLLTPVLIDPWLGRIINIHPALLPLHPGVHGIAESFASADRNLGITIHHVDHGMDTGEIIVQKSFERNLNESLEEIEKKLHALEHATYPLVVAGMLDRI